MFSSFLPAFSPFFLFFSTSATFNDYLKEGCMLRESIIRKLSGGKFDSQVIKIIENNLLCQFPNRLSKLEPLEGSVLKVILHPTNYNDFITGDLSPDGIKSKLWPQSSSFVIGQTKLTEKMQKMIFDSTNVKEIADYIIEKQDFMNPNFSISQVINNRVFIQNMISNKLVGIPNLSSNLLETLLSPVNEKLILSYQSNCGLTLPDHIITQLCPGDFFSFKFAKIEMPKEMSHRIFRLLDWNQIDNAFTKYQCFPSPSSDLNLVDFINKRIATHLCDKVVKNSRDKAIQILSEIHQLSELPLYLENKPLWNYEELCDAIKMMIVTQKLKKIVPEYPTDSELLCPWYFFNFSYIKISDEQRQRIFKLLTLEKIVNVLIRDHDSLEPSCDIAQIIDNWDNVENFCNEITLDKGSRDKAAWILAENDKLKELPLYLGDKKLGIYRELCDVIKMMILIQKLKGIIPKYPTDSNLLCPKYFFSFSYIKIPDEQRQQIFKLLKLEEIAQVLAMDEDSLRPNRNIAEIINKRETIKALCDKVLKKSKQELVVILAKIDHFKELPLYLKNKTYWTCSQLRGAIKLMIVTQKLRVIAPKYPTNSNLLCPKDFFSFSYIKIPDEQRQQIFKLLTLKEIAQVLINDRDSLKPNCDIVKIINKRENAKALCDKIAKEFENKVVRILIEINQLEELPKYLENKYICDYGMLCDVIRTIMVTQKLKRFAPKDPTDFDLPCPRYFFKIPYINISDEQRQQIFKLLTLKKIAQILAMDEDSLKSSHDILEIINKEKNVRRLCDKVTSWSYSKHKLVDILAEIDQLKELPLYLEDRYLWNYEELCDGVRTIIVIQKLKEIAPNYPTGSRLLCPQNFFNFSYIKIPNKPRRQIFKLLTLKTIAQILLHDQDVLKPNCDITQIINKDENVKGLCNKVTNWHYSKDKPAEILAEIDQLKDLPRCLKRKILTSYEELSDVIKMIIVTQKLKETVPNYPTGSHLLCPRDFFSLPCIKIPDEQRQQIFKLLKLEEIAQVLAVDKDSLEPNCDIAQIINKEETIKKLCDKIIRNQNSRYAAIYILAKFDQLKELPKYLESKIFTSYSELCKLFEEIMIFDIQFDEQGSPNQLRPVNKEYIFVEKELENFELLGLEEDIIDNHKDK